MKTPNQAKIARGKRILTLLRGRFIFQIEITERKYKI